MLLCQYQDIQAAGPGVGWAQKMLPSVQICSQTHGGCKVKDLRKTAQTARQPVMSQGKVHL